MECRKLTVVVVIVSLLTTTFAKKYDEPLCTSRFDFEDKLLHKMVRIEHAMELLQDRVSKVLTDMEREKLQMQTDVTSFKASVKDEQAKALEELKMTGEDFKQEGKKLTEHIKQDVTSFKASVKDEQTKALEELKMTGEDFKQEGKTLTEHIKQDGAGFKASVNEEQTKTLEELKRTNEDFKQEGKKLADGIETLSQQAEDKLQRMSRYLAVAMNKSAEEQVMFSVKGATGDSVNGVPTFAVVHVNIGGAYDVSTGKFTCNVKGLYSFTFTLRSTSGGYVYCFIRKNESNLNMALSEGNNDMSSATVNLALVVGDVVDVGDCFNWDTGNNYRRSASFSGMKI